jgi:hypothetical protein
MKRCPYCDWPNTDDADKCCKCRHFLNVESEPKSDYALRAFLLNNQRLFAVMGVFLVIAVFFNNPTLLNFSSPTTNAASNFTIHTECQNQKLEQNCFGNFSLADNFTIQFTNSSNHSFETNCENSISVLNCTSNLSSNDLLKTQNQPINDKLIKFFSFLSLVLFLVIAFVVVIDAFSYIQVYKNSKNKNKKVATVEILKELTIFLFLIPFAFLLIYFVMLIANAYGEFLAAGLLLFSITLYTAEILVVMYLMLGYLFSLEGDRKKELRFGWICLVVGLGSGAFFWFIVPDIINFTFSISMAFVLIAIIAFFRPSLEK